MSGAALIDLDPRTGAPVKLDREWDRARELLAEGRRTAEEFANEIERLRALHLHAGHGGDRRSKNQVSHRETLDPEKGFQAALERELSVAKATAYRILDRARYTRMLRLISEGESVKYLTGTGAKRTEKTFAPDVDAMQRARELLDDVVTGDVKPSAAFAGVVGESRRVGKTGKRERGEVDHAVNIERGLKALGTSLPHWRDVTPGNRHVLEDMWAQLVDAGLIPTTWKGISA